MCINQYQQKKTLKSGKFTTELNKLGQNSKYFSKCSIKEVNRLNYN